MRKINLSDMDDDFLENDSMTNKKIKPCKDRIQAITKDKKRGKSQSKIRKELKK